MNTTLNDVQQYVEKQIERDLVPHKSWAELTEMMHSGLSEEAGEVAGLRKRELRRFPKDLDRCTQEHFKEELGDVLWYLAGVAMIHGCTLQEIWDYNTHKLEERYGEV